jgi:hypothetical protein
MKKHKIISLLLIAILFLPSMLMAQAVEKNTLSLTLKYFNDNNKTQHLLVQAKSKIDGKFQQISDIPVQFYIGTETLAENLLGKGVTNDKGEAVLVIPPQAKVEWLKSPNQNFIVVSSANSKFDEARADLAITKAKLKIDTLEGRNIIASIVALVDTTWTPVAHVDFVVGIKRLGGLLNVNETQTYTSDSTGMIAAEFKRDRTIFLAIIIVFGLLLLYSFSKTLISNANSLIIFETSISIQLLLISKHLILITKPSIAFY